MWVDSKKESEITPPTQFFFFFWADVNNSLRGGEAPCPFSVRHLFPTCAPLFFFFIIFSSETSIDHHQTETNVKSIFDLRALTPILPLVEPRRNFSSYWCFFFLPTSMGSSQPLIYRPSKVPTRLLFHGVCVFFFFRFEGYLVTTRDVPTYVD